MLSSKLKYSHENFETKLCYNNRKHLHNSELADISPLSFVGELTYTRPLVFIHLPDTQSCRSHPFYKVCLAVLRSLLSYNLSFKQLSPNCTLIPPMRQNYKNTIQCFLLSVQSSVPHTLVCPNSVGVVNDPERCVHETRWQCS